MDGDEGARVFMVPDLVQPAMVVRMDEPEPQCGDDTTNAHRPDGRGPPLRLRQPYDRTCQKPVR